jgi:hypothetical protein
MSSSTKFLLSPDSDDPDAGNPVLRVTVLRLSPIQTQARPGVEPDQ